jgi:hypothetical protein
LPRGPEALAAHLRWQAGWCEQGGSPLYAHLLEKSAADAEVQGPVWDLLAGLEDVPNGAVLGLRFMGAVHRLVLTDSLAQLARHYPSTGGDGDPHATWPLFRQAVVDHRDEIRALAGRPCQTNEVGRSAALLGGFLELAHRAGFPLRILEIGASAGLNLRWDRYRYESVGGAWGDPGSPVTFTHSYDVPPPMNRKAAVSERKGCDLHPVDPSSEGGALTLRSSIWADQLGRLAQLGGALEVARRLPVEVEQADALSFLQRELARPAPGLATVVFHSLFMHYLPREHRQRVHEVIAESGVHELGMEPSPTIFEIRLDGELLGTSGPHGTHVRWNVDSFQP